MWLGRVGLRLGKMSSYVLLEMAQPRMYIRQQREEHDLTEILEAMTRPGVNGSPALPKRAAPKGLLLVSWDRLVLCELVED